jgi:GT2 family glycosyltransferase
MKISVVIVTRNRKDDLIQTIYGFLKQTYRDKEIIVIDNGSTDGTKETIPQLFPTVYYEWIPENFDIRSIILGVYKSEGDIIWRCDSDSFPESPDTFERVVEIFQKHPDIDIIAVEDVEVRRGNEIWHWYKKPVDKTNVPPEGYPSAGFSGGGAAIRRKVFETIGGFNGFGYEEFDFSARAIIAGFNIRYFPNIRSLHFASESERFRKERWLHSSIQFIRYTWRFFPFWHAIGRSLVIITFQLLEGVIQRVGFLRFVEGFLSMISTAIHTYRTERMVAPKDKLKLLTISGGVLYNRIKDYQAILLRKFKQGK